MIIKGKSQNDGHENDGQSKLQDMKLQDKNTVFTEITHYNEVCSYRQMTVRNVIK